MILDIYEELSYARIRSKNVRAQDREADFVRACAIEMHMDVSQQQFSARILCKHAAPRMEHPDQAPLLYRKNPSPTVFCNSTYQEKIAPIRRTYFLFFLMPGGGATRSATDVILPTPAMIYEFNFSDCF